MTTMLISDKHELADGQTCGHCGLKPQPKPNCWLCSRPMDDWPPDEEQFLRSRGWEPRHEGSAWWSEPAERCRGPVPPEMLAEAERKVKMLAEYVEELDRATRGYSPRIKPGREALELAEKQWQELQTSETVEVRPRGAFMQHEAVRVELNLARPMPPIKVEKRPRFDQKVIERREKNSMYLHNGAVGGKDQEMLDAMQGRGVAVKRGLVPESFYTATVETHACVVCHQY